MILKSNKASAMPAATASKAVADIVESRHGRGGEWRDGAWQEVVWMHQTAAAVGVVETWAVHVVGVRQREEVADFMREIVAEFVVQIGPGGRSQRDSASRGVTRRAFHADHDSGTRHSFSGSRFDAHADAKASIHEA